MRATCRYALIAVALTIGMALLLTPATAQAQGIFGVALADESEDSEKKGKYLFNFPTQANDVREALDDFQRYVGRAAWERAFEALDTARKAPEGKLIASSDRFALPIEYRLRQMLIEMPPAGREAYRLFYDAQAKKLLDEATGDNELGNLKQIVAGFFTTSVGDTAADRLGDLHFQRGELPAAADCWQTILRYSPDSQLPRLNLLMKAAIALARSGQWDAFAEIQRTVSERHAGETLVLGGNEVVAVEHLATLAKDAPAQAAAAELPDDVDLAESIAPRWQFRFLTSEGAASITQIGRNWGWGRMPISEIIPSIAHDDARLYLNYIGQQGAVDLTNGKLLWRSGKFHDLPRLVQDKYYLFPEQFAVTAGDGWLVSVFKKSEQFGNHGVPFLLGRLDAATGKAGWSSDNVGALKTWSICGTPLVAGDRIYATGYQNNNNTELHLLAVGSNDGRVIWSTSLGTSQTDQSQMYYRRTAQPSILMHGDALYVDTQQGGLAAVGAAKGDLRWGFNYDAEAPSTQYWNNPNPGLETLGPPLLHNGILYVKGMRSSRLCAIDLAAARLVWERPVSKSAVVLSIDGQRLLLGGDELSMLDLDTNRLAWVTRLPLATGWTRAAVTKNRVYQFTPRGIFVLDKQTGDRVTLARGADLDSLGGLVLFTPHGLVTVSNLAVTCYPLSGAEASEQAAR